MNLLDNAIKNTKNGIVWIKVSNFNTYHVRVSIKDTGTGIDEFKAQNVFDIFKLQQANKLQNQEQLSELGLKICQQLVSGISGGRLIEYQK